jgi:hypothetical protein
MFELTPSKSFRCSRITKKKRKKNQLVEASGRRALIKKISSGTGNIEPSTSIGAIRTSATTASGTSAVTVASLLVGRGQTKSRMAVQSKWCLVPMPHRILQLEGRVHALPSFTTNDDFSVSSSFRVAFEQGWPMRKDSQRERMDDEKGCPMRNGGR